MYHLWLFMGDFFLDYTFTYFSIIFITGFRIWCQQIHRKSSNRKKVEVWVRSYGETRCINQQKQKTKIKMKETKKYTAIYCMNCWDWLHEFRENVVDESSPSEPRGNPAPGHRDTSSSSHELPMESRAKVESGSVKHSVFSHSLKDPNCDIFLKTKITRAPCRKRIGTVVPRADKIWWLDYCRSQCSLSRKWIAEQSSICRGGTRLGNPVVTILPV